MLDGGVTINFNFNGDTSVNPSLVRADVTFPNGKIVSMLVPTFKAGIKWVKERLKRRQAQDPTKELEEELEALEYVAEHNKRQQKQILEIDSDRAIIGIYVTFSRKLTSDEVVRFNTSEEALTNLTDLLYKYDSDCRWTRGEWNPDNFQSEFTDEGMDAQSAIMLGYAMDEFFVLMGLTDIHVEQVYLTEQLTPDELEGQAERMRRMFNIKG